MAAGTYSAEGWPKTTYGVSKIGVTALTKVLARQKDIVDKKVWRIFLENSYIYLRFW